MEEELIKIFVLEDNDVFLDSIGELFDMIGIKDYSLYTDHHKFMNEFTEEVGIVLLDHKLKQGVTGLEMIQRIKKRNWNCFIIVFSAMEDPRIILQYMNEDADRYIIKGDDKMFAQLKQFLQEGIVKMQKFYALKKAANNL